MHLRGSRCKLCANEIGSGKRKYTKGEFINMAKGAHPNNLDDYSNNLKKNSLNVQKKNIIIFMIINMLNILIRMLKLK